VEDNIENFEKTPKTSRYAPKVYKEWVGKRGKSKSSIVNGKPLVYLEDVSDYEVGDAGQVILVNCDNITVANLNLSNTDVGIMLWKTENTRISNNIVSDNSPDGIYLSYFSNNNTITDNIVSSNRYNGILLSYSSNNNLLTGNIVGNNFDDGISLSYSCNNTITSNNVNSNNGDGIRLYYSSSNNKIYLNNFINNTDNVYSEGSSNIWNATEGAITKKNILMLKR
jgi:parallel beta-helix repeat protein